MSRGSEIRPAGPATTKRSAAQVARVITMVPPRENRVKHCINKNHRVNLPSLQRALINRNYAKLWYGQYGSRILLADQGDFGVPGEPGALVEPS